MQKLLKQARRFMLTINNEKKTDKQFYDYLVELEHIKYFIFQRELGEKEKVKHIQAFIIFNISKRFDTIKKMFPRAHIELCKGTNIQCRDYCSKEDTRVGKIFEFGQFCEERGRSDILQFYECVKSGMTDIELQGLFPNLYLKTFRNLGQLRQEYRNSEQQRKIRKLEVIYIYGLAGTGKTSFVYKTEQDLYRVTNYDSGAFDNYKGEKTICFDEFNSSFKISDMNNFLDIYPLLLPSRYFNKVACFDKVYIISNIPVEEQYKNVKNEQPEVWQAFRRRIHKVLKFEKNGYIKNLSLHLVECVNEKMPF